MSTPLPVFFFRGLSTYGRDRAKWSFIDLGPIYQWLVAGLGKRDITLYPVLDMQSGSLPDVAERAMRFLQQHPAWQSDQPVHFLGHSAGGLIARMLLAQAPAGKVLSCTTVATPHRGAGIAQLAYDMPEAHPSSTRLLRALGYDVAARRSFFAELTPQRVTSLMADFPQMELVRKASVVCSAPSREWCVPLRLMHKLRAFRAFDQPSDGMLERDHQPFGEVLAELRIDHFRQVGLFGEPRRFQQLCAVLADHFKTF